MTALLGALLLISAAVAVLSAAAWIVQRIRRKPTKAHLPLIAGVLAFAACFVINGVTHEPAAPAGGDVQDTAGITDQTVEPEDSEEAAEPPQEPQEQAPAQPAEQDPEPEQTPQEQPQDAAETPSEPEPTQDPEPEPEPEETPAEVDPVQADKQEIEAAARQICEDNYTMTTISSLAVNENYGTDEDGDYVLLVYATWEQKNNPDLTKTVLTMYSEDFAARVGEDLEKVNEFAIFWTVPYYSETDTAVKFAYERSDGGMYQTDSMIANFLN